MRSEFLENETQDYQGAGAMGLVASLYGWSTLDMIEKVHSTGRFYVPWSAAVRKGGIRQTGRGTLFKAAPKIVPGRVTPADAFRPILMGDRFVGKNLAGSAALMVSKGVGYGMSAMVWTDPLWFAFRHAANPLMWPVGVAYFAGGAMAKGVARAMERTRYVDMSVPFMETQASYTSRQRAVRAISESHLQARSAIANEAQLFHR